MISEHFILELHKVTEIFTIKAVFLASWLAVKVPIDHKTWIQIPASTNEWHLIIFY